MTSLLRPPTQTFAARSLRGDREARPASTVKVLQTRPFPPASESRSAIYAIDAHRRVPLTRVLDFLGWDGEDLWVRGTGTDILLGTQRSERSRPIVVDRRGRVTLPPGLLHAAGLAPGRQVLVAGTGFTPDGMIVLRQPSPISTTGLGY